MWTVGCRVPFAGPVSSLLADDPHWAYVSSVHWASPFALEFDFDTDIYYHKNPASMLEVYRAGAWHHPSSTEYFPGRTVVATYSTPITPTGHWRIRDRPTNLRFEFKELWWPQQGTYT